MKNELDNIKKAYEILKSYNGDNSYIITLKNNVFAYKTDNLNDFQIDFIIRNYDKCPKYVDKIVKIADWYGAKLKEKWEIDFEPKVLLIGWYLGDTTTHYVFYCKYRKSQDKGEMLFAPKNAILTDFLIEDFGKGIQDLVSQIDQSRIEVVGIVGIRGQPGGIRIHLDVSGIDNFFKDRGSVFDPESELGVGIGISEAGRLHIAEIP